MTKSYQGEIDLLVVSNLEIATVRAVDWRFLRETTAAVTATAVPAPRPAGQILYTASTGTDQFVVGKNYAFTAAAPPVPAQHKFAPSSVYDTGGLGGSLWPIWGNEIIDVAAFGYTPKVYPIWEFDFTGETIVTDVAYMINITLPMRIDNQMQAQIFSYAFPIGTPAGSLTPTNLCDQFVLAINQNPRLSPIFVASNVAGVLRLTGTDLALDGNLSTQFGYVENGGFTAVSTITNTVVGKKAVGDYAWVKNLTYRFRGMNWRPEQVFYQRELIVEANPACYYDSYKILHATQGEEHLVGRSPFLKESWIVIERNPEATDVANADVSIMAVKTMLRNYLNTMRGFGLLPDVDSNGQTVTGIWGS